MAIILLIIVLFLSGCAVKDTEDKTVKATDPVVEESSTPTASNTVTEKPTIEPTVKPTVLQTTKPTAKPTVKPTNKPTAKPTAKPTLIQTEKPTSEPTVKPTATPAPTANPSPEATNAEDTFTKTVYSGSPLAGYTIGIDPGHQRKSNRELELISPTGTATKKKVSSGTYGRYTGVNEYIINLQVGLKLRTELQKLGAKVVMTRTSHDVNISNAERAVMMNEANVDCWIRIHANGSDDKTRNGLYLMAPTQGTMNTTEPGVAIASERLALKLQKYAIDRTGARDPGIRFRADQTGFSWSSVPVNTIEMGYMTNEKEDRLLVTDLYQDKIVDGLVKGFVEYLK